MSKQRSKYQKVINIELLEGQKSKIENALHEKKGVTLLTRFTKESTRPMLLTKRQINQIQRSVAVDPNKAINITMSADQLHQSIFYHVAPPPPRSYFYLSILCLQRMDIEEGKILQFSRIL